MRICRYIFVISAVYTYLNCRQCKITSGKSVWSLGPASKWSLSEEPFVVMLEALNTTRRWVIVLPSRITGWCGMNTDCSSETRVTGTSFMCPRLSYSSRNAEYSWASFGWAWNRHDNPFRHFSAMARDWPMSIGGPFLNGRRTIYRPSGQRVWVTRKCSPHFSSSGLRLNCRGISSTSQKFRSSLSSERELKQWCELISAANWSRRCNRGRVRWCDRRRDGSWDDPTKNFIEF